jgi:hypothetical protein
LIILFVALGFAVRFVDGTSGGHLGLFSGFLDRREWRAADLFNHHLNQVGEGMVGMTKSSARLVEPMVAQFWAAPVTTVGLQSQPLIVL